jgi:hypothetical protein
MSGAILCIRGVMTGRKVNNKISPGARLTDQLDLSAILVKQFSAIEKPNTHSHAAHQAGFRGLGAEKRLEDLALQVPGNARTSVLNADLNTRVVTLRRNGQTLLGVFDHCLSRVTEDIPEDLVNLQWNAPQRRQTISKLPPLFNLVLEIGLALHEENFVLQDLVDVNPF